MITNSKYFVNTFEDRVYRWKSSNANNPFVARWDTFILKDSFRLDTTTDLLFLIREKEKTGLFNNEQWTHYNIFSWKENCIHSLQEYIKEQYQYLCNVLGVQQEKTVYVNGWVYPQKKGQTLQRHNHAVHENSFLSGNLCLTSSSNIAKYHIPYLSDAEGNFEVESKPGTFLLFPSYLPHSSNTLEEETRYVIAFDLITQRGLDDFRKYSNNPQDPIYRAVLL